MTRPELHKLAAKRMLQLLEENRHHTKQARAIELVFKQAEAGLGPLPRNYSELREKVASLLSQDLNIVEKALDLTTMGSSFGQVDRTSDVSAGGGKPEDAFQSAVLGD